MPPKVSRGFSFFGGGGSTYDTSKDDKSTGILKKEFAPCLKLQTDKEVYRPGDVVTAIVEISNPRNLTELSDVQPAVNDEYSFLIENLKFEVKGIEKLDTQWFATQKPLPGSKQRRGEQVFLDCTTPSIASKVMVSSGHAKTYIVRAELPKIIPPSYRGSSIRYLYYVRSMLSGYWLVLDNGHSNRESRKDLIQLEARAPLQIWVTQKTSGLLAEEGQTNGILPVTTVHVDIYWKEKDADSEWVRANEISDALEDGYESSRDEISSVSSYNPTKGIDLGFQNSLSLQSSTSRLSNAEAPYIQGERSNHPSYMTPPKLSVAEVSYDPGGDILSPRQKSTNSSSILSPSQQRRHSNSHFTDDDTGVPSTLGNVEPAASEGFIRGRSYNIRMDDQVLLRFSPKNSDSTYYFGDMIGGTLTFFHEEGARRCLEISITLEISETISQRYVHPSRRNSTTITKVQSDHYEIVADLVQTSFLFSIPVDGPMSFSTLHVSVHWALRFEFLTTPKYVDWRRYMPSGPSLPGLAAGSRWVILLMLSKNFDEKVEIFLNMYSFDVPPVDILSADVETWKLRYEHPLLIEGRDKSEWVLPIAVHAPPLRTQSAQAKNEKPLSLGALWVRS